MKIYPTLEIPETLAAGPGPGNTDPRVLERFAKTGVADHMQKDVVRGMLEAKEMLRDLWGTKNVYTYGVAGTGFSGLDCVLSLILPGDKVVAFPNGTFSGIDSLTIRMKASTAEELAADSLNPKPASVTIVETPHGQSVTGETVDKALGEHKPLFAFMAHWETGSGRINDLKGFSDACVKHGVMGIVDAVSSLGVADFNIDDYPGVVAWASCPQKGVLSLPLTYAPVSFTDKAIELVKKRGCRTYVHHPSSMRATGASSTARTCRTRSTTRRIRATRWPPSTRRCASSSAMDAAAKPPTTPITRRRCGRRSRPWAATSPPT